MKNYWKEKYKEQEWLLDTATWELTVQNMRIANLLNVFDEIETFTTDPIAKKVIQNVKERDALDKMIHTRILFERKRK